MNRLDKQYTDLLQDIIDNGIVKSDRTGTGTKSVFGRQIRHKMSDGFPLLTTKKLHWGSIVSELLWFLSGSTDIRDLWSRNCKIWDGDCYRNYYNKECIPPHDHTLNKEQFIEKIKTNDEFGKKWGDLGPIYGKQWRNWERIDSQEGVYNIDQIKNLLDDLINNPDSRRLMVSAWNVGELGEMTLPPCHYGFQIYTRELTESERWDLLRNKAGVRTIPWDRMSLPSHEWLDKVKTLDGIDNDFKVHKGKTIRVPKREISLMWNQRSVDTFLGLPFNIASYGLLLEMLANEVNMVPGELIGNLGDTHLYLNHIEQAKEQIGREYTIEERYKLYSEDHEITMNHHMLSEEVLKTTPSRTREPFELPTVEVQDGMYSGSNDIVLLNYQSHKSIKAPLSN